MKERVIGIENEFAMFSMHEEVAEGLLPGIDTDATFVGRALKEAHGESGIYDGARLWLPNGGCLYIDVQKLEWASPECRRIRDVVLYNKVGECLIDSVAKWGSERRRHVHFFKTNVSPREKTSENTPTASAIPKGTRFRIPIY